MDYKLAKQLDDLKFPGSEECPISLGCCEPTLEELIEACKKSGGYTGFSLRWTKGDGAIAKLYSLADNPKAVGKDEIEAVAKLYITLNK